MFTKKIKEDLDKLVVMGTRQNYKLNSIIFYNLFLGLPETARTEETLEEMRLYLQERQIEVVEDGVELEENDGVIGVKRIAPFDPSKIDIDMKTMELASLIKRIRYEEVNLDTDFQRKAGLWTKQQKSQLIESLFLRIPIPAFYFDGGDPDNWLIIDGLQRITTLKEFVVDESLALTGLEFFEDLEGMKFSELPRAFVRRIEESNIIAFIVKGGTPSNVKYNIFKRINTGGLELSPQEIRHALYQGRAAALCKKLAGLPEFKEATSHSIREDRMADQEFVARFIAVCYYGTDQYEGVPDDYLNGAMEYLNLEGSEASDKIERRFQFVMSAAFQIMGKYAFRKLAVDGMRRPINKAIYEAWCKNLFSLEEEQVQTLIRKKETVYQSFLKLCESEAFLAVIKASDRKAFLLRFQMVEGLFWEVLDDKQD